MARGYVAEDDDVLRLSFVGRLARRRWRLLGTLLVLGGLLGYASSLVLSPGYEAASLVLLQDASGEEELATEAQIAASQVVLDRTALGLGGITGQELRKVVTASVVGGNVIEIRAVAPTPSRVVQLVDRVSAEYVAFSTELVSASTDAANEVLQERRTQVEQRIDEATARITELQASPVLGEESAEGALARAELDRVGGALADATGELNEIDGNAADSEADAQAGRTSISVLEPAVLLGTAEPSPPMLVAIGAIGLAVVGLFVLIGASRSDRRLRTGEDIAAAAGAPLLGSVGAVVDPADVVAARRSLRERLVDGLRDDRARDVPAGSEPAAEAVRFRRALARVRSTVGASPRLLVPVSADDAAARSAVARLASAAASVGERVTVVTTSERIRDLVGAGAAPLVSVREKVDRGPVGPGVEIHVVDVDMARPTVPETWGVHGAVLVVGIGTRVAWELVGLSGACAEAGHPVLGVLAVTATAPTGKGGPPPDEQPTAQADGHPTDGHTTNGHTTNGHTLEGDLPAGPVRAGSS